MNKAKTLRAISALLKVLGIVTMTGNIPFISPAYGVLIFALASTAKDGLQTFGDWLDDGKINKSFVGLLALCALICFASGCAMAQTTQTAAADGSAKTRTFVMSIWDAKGTLNNFKATQSSKTQSTTLGTSGAESTSTNLVTITGHAAELVKIIK